MEVFEEDRFGQVIEPDKAKTVNILVANQLRMPHGHLSFRIAVRVPKESLSQEDAAESIAIHWLHKNLPSKLANAKYWDFFHLTWLDSGTPDSTGQAMVPEPSNVDIVLADSLATQLERDLFHVEEMRKKFEEAKQRLGTFVSNNTPFGFQSSLSQARGLFGVLEKVLSASADVGGYRGCDIRSAARNYEELAGRKNENNHIYKTTLSYLQDVVFRVRFPECWKERPQI